MDSTKDAVDHLCATDPIWTGALQLVQLAKSQTDNDTDALAQLMCAIMIFASDARNPQALLEHCADGLRNSPFKKVNK